jgi:hypothetical protein
MDHKPPSPTSTRCVYLCFAPADRTAAAKLGVALRVQWQVPVTLWEIPGAGTLAQRIDQSGAPGDVVLLLLSRASADTDWTRAGLGACQLAAALQDVSMLALLTDDCNIPASLNASRCIDLRGDLNAAPEALWQRLAVATPYELRAANPRAFREAIAALFRKLGFAVQPRALLSDSDIDLLVSTRATSPTGVMQSKLWLVITRHCDGERISISETMQLFYSLATTHGVRRGLLVTNGQLTPIALGYANECGKRADREIHLLDGGRLGRLLAQHPDVAQRYFRGSIKQG